MPYSQFTTISKAKVAFGLQVQEARFLPPIAPITPSSNLQEFLEQSLPIASVGSEKARSEMLIAPVLLEVRRILNQRISLFSGEDFSIDESVGLNGICDFLLSLSPEILEITAPAIVIVEAKKVDITLGLGQCIAEMVAAQRFNEQQKQPIPIIYGAVSSGTIWRFMQLERTVVTIDLLDYTLPPIEQILGVLVWMLREGEEIPISQY